MTAPFDRNDPNNLGRPLYWDLQKHIEAVEQMLRADELILGLEMCDKIPAWYRENYPKELYELKRKLFKNLYDIYTYAADPEEAGWTKEAAELQFGSAYTYPRAEILREIVARYNQQGEIPWICEFSTSHGLLPLGLQREGHKFNFFGKNLNHQALVKLKGWLNEGVWSDSPKDGQAKVFVFCEALEHAMREKDLYDSYMKLGIEFDEILLSVPNGTLGGGLPNWDSRPLGHVRTYNAKEFLRLADEFFPGYSWKLYKSVSLVLHGFKGELNVERKEQV